MTTKQTEEGRTAFQAGTPRHENPYNIENYDWTAWMDGFDQAQTEAEIKARARHPKKA